MARLVRAATDRNPPTLGGGGCQEVFPDEHGTNTLVITTLTPKDKKKRWFQKLGQMEETCRYFYDHNF